MAITKRILTQSAAPAIPASQAGNPWGAAFGGAWGQVWALVNAAIPAIAEQPSINTTGRVGTSPSGGITQYITPNFLALEGDESGLLLLEGDMQSGDDALKLEGDESMAAGSSILKRVPS